MAALACRSCGAPPSLRRELIERAYRCPVPDPSFCRDERQSALQKIDTLIASNPAGIAGYERLASGQRRLGMWKPMCKRWLAAALFALLAACASQMDLLDRPDRVWPAPRSIDVVASCAIRVLNERGRSESDLAQSRI